MKRIAAAAGLTLAATALCGGIASAAPNSFDHHQWHRWPGLVHHAHHLGAFRGTESGKIGAGRAYADNIRFSGGFDVADAGTQGFGQSLDRAGAGAFKGEWGHTGW